MATRKKKEQRKQRRAQEAVAANRKKKLEADSSQKEAKATTSGSSQIKDSEGRTIPSEEQRHSAQERVIPMRGGKVRRDAKARAKVKNTRRYDDKDDEAAVAAKRKVKYVLDRKAKNWLMKVAAVVVVVIVAIVVGVLIASRPSSTSSSNIEAISEQEKKVSLTGLTVEGEQIMEATGEFDDFLMAGTIPIASIYDTQISLDDSEVLKERKQYPTEGIFAYNEEIALKKRNSEENAENTPAPEQDTTVGMLSR